MPYFGVTPGTAAGADLDGKELILDADANTTITADTDDTIDIKIAGADDFQFTANKFLVQTGSNIDMNGTELILDADADTSITADTDDQIDIRIAGADDFQFTANTFTAQSGSTIAAQALTATLITPSLPITYSNATGLTAGTTQTQAGGLALTKEINTITVVGTDADAVTLPTAVAGMKVRIYNKDASQYLRVWPFSGDAIDGASANAVDGNVIFAGGWREYTAYDATNWLTTAQSAMTAVGVFTYATATATGTQAITGLGFKPVSIHVFANQANVPGRFSIGFALGTTEFSMRDSHEGTADAFYPTNSFIIAMGGSTNRSHAVINSMDTDGFTLGWTKNGSPSGDGTIQYLAFR